MIEEMHHADRLVDRIIFLDGHPNLQTVAPLRDRPEHPRGAGGDLAGEYDARNQLFASHARSAAAAGDYVSMELFEDLLKDEEGHIDFLETQIDSPQLDRRAELHAAERRYYRRRDERLVFSDATFGDGDITVLR